MGRWLSVLALVVACDPAPQPAMVLPLPPPGVLELVVGPAFAGRFLTFSVTGATPGAVVRVYGGARAPGGGPCPPELGGACLDLSTAQAVGDGNVAADGSATVRLYLRPSYQGVVAFQAGQLTPAAAAVSPPRAADIEPFNVDSDGDGLTDADEVLTWGTDPFSPDGDEDGAWDVTELALGTDPTVPDEDGDGILDGDDFDPTTPGPFDSFVPDDVNASLDNDSLPDPEFHAATGRGVFQDANGAELWAFDINPFTGRFDPRDGRGQLVTTDITPMSPSKNGPEWGDSVFGPEVVYLRDDGADIVLWHARDRGGRWYNEEMPGRTVGLRPQGHRDAGVLRPYVTIRREDGDQARRGWRDSNDPNSVSWLPDALRGNDGHRWVLDPHPYIIGVSQLRPGTAAFIWDAEQRNGVVVTHSRSWKTRPRSWLADDFGGDRAYTLLESDESTVYTDVVTYRQTPTGFVEVSRVRPPPSLPVIEAIEILRYDGHSYAAIVAVSPDPPLGTGAAGVFLLGVDPANPLFRRLDNGEDMFRGDTEAYTGGARPWVYYTELHPSGRKIIHRCETGL